MVPLLVVFRYAELRPAIMGCQLCLAALLCGAALSVGGERGVRGTMGLYTGCVATALCCTLGLSILWSGCPPDFWPLPCLLIGVGVGSDWSSVSDVARRSLSTTARWQGLRIWSVAFSAGSAVGILLIIEANDVAALFYPTIALAATACILMLFGKPLAAIRPIPDAPAGVPAKPPESESAEAEPDPAEECDATECCGGGVRELQPTSFRHGVLLAAVGVLTYYLAPWFVLVSGIRSQPFGTFDTYAALAFAIGLPAGTWLVISAAPRIGYVVAVLPFLLLSVVCTMIYGFASLSGTLLMAVAFCCGLFPAAASTGISAMVGELFSDCPTDAKRSAVLSVALFAAAAVMSVFSIVQIDSLPHAVQACYLPFVAMIGLLTIRSLPSPVISSLGKDDDGSSEDEELKDVIAQISRTE